LKSGAGDGYCLIAFAACLGLILSAFLADNVYAEDKPVQEIAVSDFHELAINLRQFSRAVKVDFALAAIAETVILYQHETDSAESGGDSLKLKRWARSADSYIDSLRAIAASITPSTAIGIFEGEGGFVYLLIEGQPVIISGPTPAKQDQLERTITQHFCGQYACDSLIENYSGEHQGHFKTLPHWQFRLESVSTCSTGDGLELEFNRHTELQKKRDICKQLVTELSLLADALALQQKSGVSIEWHELAIYSTPDSEQAHVALNSKGDSATLPIPGCAASPALISQVLPWLHSKVAGDVDGYVLLVVTNAEELIAPLLQESTLVD